MAAGPFPRRRPGGLKPAGREGRVVVIDTLLLLGFGPRTAQAAAQLGSQLHPSVTLPAALR